MDYSLNFFSWFFNPISQGYHHIDIDEQHQKYLGFSWKIKGQTKYFIFTVLPIGLTSAPFLFTTVMRSLVTFWTAQGIKISVFNDDEVGSADKVQSNIHLQHTPPNIRSVMTYTDKIIC